MKVIHSRPCELAHILLASCIYLGKIHVYGLDLLNGTPIIDIKPYVAAFDAFPDAKAGWMDDITNPVDGRINGYQQIKSSRGARRARSRNRVQKLGEDSSIDNEEEATL